MKPTAERTAETAKPAVVKRPQHRRERVLGVLKQHYRLAKARYLGLKRFQARFMLAAMAYNLKRGVAVQAEMVALAG